MDILSRIEGFDFKSPGFLAIVGIFILSLTYTLLAGSLPQGEDAMEGFLFTVLLHGGGLFLFYSGFRTYRELQLIRNTPTSKIRSMAMGTVEVKGKAEKGGENAVLQSPFSGEECLFYTYTVEEYRSDDDGGHWATIDSGREGLRFLVRDETGEVIVDPEGADLEIPADNTYTVNSFEDSPPGIQEFVKRNEDVNQGSNELLSIFDNRRRYTERYVTPNEELYIFGYAATENDKQGEYTVIKHSKSVPMFKISDRSEKELREKKGLYYKLKIVGGIVAAPVGLALMFMMTGIL